MFVFTRWQQLSVLKYYIMAPSWTSMSMSMFLKSQFKGFFSEVPSKGLLSQAPLQVWSCGSRKFGSRFKQSTVYACVSKTDDFQHNGEKRKNEKEKRSYFREGKSHSNCSDYNKMVPEPIPNSIQAASNVDFILQSQTLSKRPKQSLLLTSGKCPVLEKRNHVLPCCYITCTVAFRMCSSNIHMWAGTYIYTHTTPLSHYTYLTLWFGNIKLVTQVKIKLVNIWKWSWSRHVVMK